MADVRIARVVTRLNVGGPARHVATLSALDDRWASQTFAGRAPTHEGNLVAPGHEVVDVPLRREVAPGADLRALMTVRRHLLRVRPEIVETHMAKAGAVGRVAARSIPDGPATVHVFHGHVLSGYFSTRVEQAFATLERGLARWTDVLVAVSEATRDDLLGLGIGVPEQWRVVRLGIDPEGITAGDPGALRSELGLSDEPLLGVVGRLAQVKRVDRVIDLMAQLPNVHVAIVGDGPARGDLEAKAAMSSASGRVHFLGMRSDLADVYAGVDVVVLSSVNEGTPMSLIEAAAAGRPVVATDVGGVGEVVTHERTGLLVASGDAAALADALRRVVADPGLRARLGAAAAVHVRERFGTGRLLHETEAVYELAIARCRQRSRSRRR